MHAILTSWIVGCLMSTGCTNNDPYLREVKPAYNDQGVIVPDAYQIPKPYLKHLLKDLKACYKDGM
ncbi:MAG: hypothetical protein ACRCZI_13995 [Cetobacterium sp.]